MVRKALIVLIISVALSALLGIIALLSGDFGKTEGKILLTTLTVAGVSILAMASSAAWERGVGRAYAAAGSVTAVLGGALTLIGVWGEVKGDGFWKLVGSLIVLAMAGAHGALLFFARLVPRFAWIRPATLVVSLLLTILILAVIWGDLDIDDIWRVVGILSILAAAGTIVLGVFQRMSRDELREEEPSDAVCCPHCGGVLPPELLAR